MSEPKRAAPRNCTICEMVIDSNPRLDRWLAGNLPEKEFSKVGLCWTCRRLNASVVQESAEYAAGKVEDQ